METWPDRVRGAYAAFNRGDLASALAIVSPDVEAVDHERTLDQRTYRGHEGFLQLAATVNEGFVDVTYTAERVHDLGERVLVEVRRSGRGATSGVTVEERQYHLFEVADGAVVRFSSFVDPERAHAEAER